MSIPSSTPLRSQKKTLRSPFRLVYLLLRTALWTAMIASCGIYLAYDSLTPAPPEPSADAALQESPPPEKPGKADAANLRGRRQKDPGSMEPVKGRTSEPPRMPATRRRTAKR